MWLKSAQSVSGITANTGDRLPPCGHHRRQRDHKGMNLAVTEDDTSVPPAGLALTFNTYTAMSSTAGLDIN
ncbi:unnamed protein product [Arctogadus glacialis]